MLRTGATVLAPTVEIKLAEPGLPLRVAIEAVDRDRWRLAWASLERERARRHVSAQRGRSRRGCLRPGPNGAPAGLRAASTRRASCPTASGFAGRALLRFGGTVSGRQLDGRASQKGYRFGLCALDPLDCGPSPSLPSWRALNGRAIGLRQAAMRWMDSRRRVP